MTDMLINKAVHVLQHCCSAFLVIDRSLEIMIDRGKKAAPSYKYFFFTQINQYADWSKFASTWKIMEMSYITIQTLQNLT